MVISVKRAEDYLNWAEKLNPGPWVDHSKVVANAAATIAEHSGLDSDRTHALGLVHDLGRYKGVTSMMHIYDGYSVLIKDGYSEAAQICITHSFPTQTFEEYTGQDDCTDEIRQEIKTILANAAYSDYDRLIQLCDALALPSGVCLMEKRLVDVALRHGANELMIEKWKKMFSPFQYFQGKMNRNLYDLFPEAVRNTFSGLGKIIGH